MSENYTLLKYFHHIYIINLASRPDRKSAMVNQFNSIKLNTDNSSDIEFINAIRPDSAGEFESIGARGCFLSHLTVLKDAYDKGYKRILILEDDTNFCKNFNQLLPKVLNQLDAEKWHIFMGNYREYETKIDLDSNKLISLLPKKAHVQLTNFMAIQGEILPNLINHLELMLSRKGGDPLGGPMHVDGAYCWFNDQHKQYNTFLSNASLGYQRSSKSDIHTTSKWADIKSIFNKKQSFQNIYK